MQPTLLIFSGLPGAGKTTISQEIAKHFHATYFRIDTIEHGIQELCNFDVQGEGYRLTYRITRDNLQIGNTVVIDCCNPIQLTRDEWETIASENNANYLNIEVICSDKREHQKRVENRMSDIQGFEPPSWEEVLHRNYDKWNKEVITIETAHRSILDCVTELIGKIEAELGNFV
jgi:predicted kinase